MIKIHSYDISAAPADRWLRVCSCHSISRKHPQIILSHPPPPSHSLSLLFHFSIASISANCLQPNVHGPATFKRPIGRRVSIYSHVPDVCYLASFVPTSFYQAPLVPRLRTRTTLPAISFFSCLSSLPLQILLRLLSYLLLAESRARQTVAKVVVYPRFLRNL